MSNVNRAINKAIREMSGELGDMSGRGKRLFNSLRDIDYNGGKNGMMRLYHNTSSDNVDSIIRSGLLAKKAKELEYEGMGTWFETTPNLKGYGGNTVAVDIPMNSRMKKMNNSQYIVFDDIKPDNISFIDEPVFGDYRMSDLRDKIDKYGGDRVLEVFSRANPKQRFMEEQVVREMIKEYLESL